MIERVVQITQAAIRNRGTGVTLEDVLRGIHYFRVHDHTELVALLRSMPNFLEQRAGQVKLLVVDSVAAHFRHDFDDMALRTRLLSSVAQDLALVAEKNQLAVCIGTARCWDDLVIVNARCC